jgi:phosphoribosylamine--glycine ligase
MPKNCPAEVNVLLIGNGGREHALAWKLSQSKRLGTLWIAQPGNPGIDALGRAIDVPYDIKQAYRLQQFCDHKDIGLVVIGPEAPLAEGWSDLLASESTMVFGPSQQAAQLECSKAWAKQLMRQASIPTAESRTFRNVDVAREYVRTRDEPMVIKASGLAAGKGVVICNTPEEGLEVIEQMMVDRAFGAAADEVIVEEKLTGQEVSVFALIDGHNMWILDASQDHKQLNEGDTGPNTGGMGAYCPTPLVDADTLRTIQSDILVPTVDGLRREGIEYRGILYMGLMLTAGGPKVLEYNVRFGDPECQAMMVRLDCDLIDVLWSTAAGSIERCDISVDQRVACCVVMASQGYPGAYEKGRVITGLEAVDQDSDTVVFHAGVQRLPSGELATSGGRVLGVTSLADTLEAARDKANAWCERIEFEGAYFRRDIGDRVLKTTV